MLWYKNWLETKWWFVFSLLLMGIPASAILLPLFGGGQPPPLNSGSFLVVSIIVIVTSMYFAGSGVRTPAFVDLSTIIKTKNSTAYTLSLPVSRCRLLLTKAAVGFTEALALGLVWIFLAWILCPWGEMSVFDMGRALMTAVICAVPYFFLATFLSTFLNDSFYWIIYVSILFLPAVLAKYGWALPVPDISLIIRHTVESGGILWLPMAGYIAVGGILLFASIKVVESRDY
jgi:hypothetical protein